MKIGRPLVLAGTIITSLTMATPALAAPGPANDRSRGAIPVTLGYSATLDTSRATTDAEDAQLNETCGAPATDASVWYTFTPAVDGGVVVDVSASSYTAGVLVGEGSPGALTTVACAPGAVGFFATAGTTYYLLAIDDQFDGGGNGGTLSITVAEAPPPPTVDFTVDPVGRITRSGEVLLSGTFSCTNADFLDAFGDLAQRAGRVTIRGFFGFFADGSQCDGTTQPWTATVVSDNGKFAGGKTAAVTFTFACGQFECSDGFAEHVIKLRGGG